MTYTDIPLKILVHEFAVDFAAWLLGVDYTAIHHVQPLNIELPAGAVRPDTVFRVTLADGRKVVLHVEFQGRGSRRPMPLRMLDYLSRLAQQGVEHLCSAVLYVGDGAGAGDRGFHRIECLDGGMTLAWGYRVVRLWEMEAAEVLRLGRPALVTLIGQMRLGEPEREVAEAVGMIRGVEDKGERIRLLAALTNLMRDEEVLRMVEGMIEATEREKILETPFLRRIREEAWARGRAEGLTEGLARGREEGLNTLRESILDVLAARFNPPAIRYRDIEVRLKAVTEPKALRSILLSAIQASDIAAFEQTLETQAVADR